MVAISRRLPRPSWLALVGGAAVILSLSPVTAAADSPAAATSPDVDALWNQPQGTRPDSAFYVIQLWWDGLMRARQHDRTQRGLQELAQANTDLLNAYALLQEQRDDPGPHPVPGVDPLLSGAYGFITGVHVKAPIGSLLSWANQSVVQVEGRGDTDGIVAGLLRDYRAQRSAASRDLGSATAAPTGGVWAANSARESAMLKKITVVASPSLEVASLLADSQAGGNQGNANGNGAASATGKGTAHGQSGDPHGKSLVKKPAKP
ncbi:MAG: hypothetical protein ABI401_01445 [Candidatus Dormibacter sp.]